MATTIGRGLRIKGQLTADEPLEIAGSVDGEVLVANHGVTIGRSGRLDGAVTARVITIQGGTVGRLVARDVVRVLAGAVVNADIATPKLALEEGALFNGRVGSGTRFEAAARVAEYRRAAGPAEPGAGRR